jgi:pimeloyl-ACP methyl ester carboxylesterase
MSASSTRARRVAPGLALALIVGCGSSNSSIDDGGRITPDAGDDERSDGATPDADTPSDGGTSDAAAPAPCLSAPTATAEDAFAALRTCLARVDVDAAARAEALETFTASIEALGGFPFRTSRGFVVFYVNTERWNAPNDKTPRTQWHVDLRQPPFRVSGDFDAWDPSGVPLIELGADAWYAELAVPTSTTARVGYKLVAKSATGDDVWFSDPLSRRFDFDRNGRISLLQAGRGLSWLEWVREAKATRLGNDRPVYVWLPARYADDPSERFPVLYMHDGNNLFDARQARSAAVSWRIGPVIDEEVAAGRVRAPIVVGIANTSDRRGEYTFVEDDTGPGPQGGRSADYVDFVVRELVPIIDARYRTLTDAANTGVFGSSLGGLVSFDLGLRHPERFGLIGGMSSVVGWGDIGLDHPNMIARYAATTTLAAAGQRFYLDTGGGLPTSGRCPGPGEPQSPYADLLGPEDFYCQNLRMRDTLVALGIDRFPVDPDAPHLAPTDANIYHYFAPNTPHHESAWHARFFRVLRFFFPAG